MIRLSLSLSVSLFLSVIILGYNVFDAIKIETTKQ